MKAQDLKNSILQLAIQGKLVPQNPNDEYAEVLYTQIQSEKQKLIKEGKIKKDKPLPPITDDEIPFKLPSTWKWVRLGEICNSYQPQTIPTSMLDETGRYYVYGANGIIGKYNKYNHEETELLITCRGATCGTVNFSKPFSWINGNAMVVKPFLNKEIIYYLAKYFELKGRTPSLISGTAQPQIVQKILNLFLIPLPPLAEQKRIVAKIEELEPLVKQYDKAETELSDLNEAFPKQLKKSILQYAIQGKLVPQDPNDEPADLLYERIQSEKQQLIKEGKIKKDKPLPPITDDEIPFQIPSTWKWVRLGDCLDVRDGTHDTPKYVNVGIPLITSKNLYNGFLDLSNVKYISTKDAEKINERSKVHKNDILFAMIGTIGNPVIVNVIPNFCIKNMALIKNNEFIDIKYVEHFLTHIQNDMKKQAQGAVQSFVSLSFIRNFPIPLPPLAEQKRIVAKIDELMQCCDKLTP